MSERDERMQEIKGLVERSHSPSLTIERYKFLLAEISWLEEVNRTLADKCTHYTEHSLRARVEHLEKQVQELRAANQQWLKDSERMLIRENRFRDKLDIAVGALEKIRSQDRVRGYPSGTEWIALMRQLGKSYTELIRVDTDPRLSEGEWRLEEER